jgi:Fe-Mn family superoxide dismutase
MSIQLKPLPYPLDALEPVISRKTLQHHYLKHHQGYVDKLNGLIASTPYESMTLEEIIFESSIGSGKDKKIFNNAAQVWNHTFYWNCMTPKSNPPSQFVREALMKSFDSEEDFFTQFAQAGKDLFGSGYIWLSKDESGSLKIEAKSNAETPLTEGETPILTCDVWEHAYYLDQQENRAKYLEEFRGLINWQFVEANLQKSPLFTTSPSRKSAKNPPSELHQ